MHGNVLEWCADPWHENYTAAPSASRVWDEECQDERYHNYPDFLPILLADKRDRIERGGEAFSWPQHCRCASRFYSLPDEPYNDSFRVVCAVQ
ncbi:MAG: formylglycine-generating enzyme family protein [Spirulinaceae cyanobacterium]